MDPGTRFLRGTGSLGPRAPWQAEDARPQAHLPTSGRLWYKMLSGVERARTVIYHRPMEYKPNIYSSASSSTTPITPLINVELPDWLNSDGAQFLYLWQPGL